VDETPASRFERLKQGALDEIRLRAANLEPGQAIKVTRHNPADTVDGRIYTLGYLEGPTGEVQS
jgi:hypothetical protein